MSVDRLTAEDQLLLWPDRRWPQDIGALAVLDGAALLDPDGRLRTEVVEEAIARRLHLVPRFRQVLLQPPRWLGRPLWVDDASFDLGRHVRIAEVETPGDDAAMLACVETLRRRRLDMSRPLWEAWFLTGLPQRRVGLFLRLHHVLADGIAGVATIPALFDTLPDGPAPTAPPWTPAAAPSLRELATDHLHDSAARLRRSLASVRGWTDTVHRLRQAWPSLRELLAEQKVAATSLNRVVGEDRSLTVLRSRLDDIHAVAAAHGATVNDVLLTLTAGGLRTLLDRRGELTEERIVRVYVPVTLRQGAERKQARGNLISQMIVSLPVGVAGSEARLRAIAHQTARRKARRHPSLATVFRGRLGTVALLRVVRLNPVNVETTDVPGPVRRLYLAGAAVLEVFPLLNLLGNVPLGVGALSYAGQFGVMVVADRDAVPDLDAFTEGAAADLAELTASRAGGRAPQ